VEEVVVVVEVELLYEAPVVMVLGVVLENALILWEVELLDEVVQDEVVKTTMVLHRGNIVLQRRF
jgi:hypothetical protein